ncbi:hypothetical protein SAMN05428997_1404 [Bosea sp. CRIB-10]|uniref:hypothetical protein n=1 Tax=Bosea sp. CRIB-10 TaxID=378404 RepID=UPI0008E481F1|nr:hypothetical protein [Bosea sp. CRIB-10]SFD66508.1 hypothetical protein SAMN05428997_1404 [Bosea sp. CRIB-10]
MSKCIAMIVALALAAGGAGCATSPEITTQTVVVSGIGPVEVERLSVRIVSIDRTNRSVVVEQGGNTWRVDVPPVFGNLDRVREGDMVEIRRIEGVLLDMGRSKRGSRPAITYTEAASEPQFQNLPDRFVVRSIRLTARFERFDTANSVVSYVGPFGPRTLTVVDPQVKAELQRLRRGDMVDLSLAEAFYIGLS